MNTVAPRRKSGMNRSIPYTIVLLTLCAGALSGQMRRGSFELSCAATAGSENIRIETTFPSESFVSESSQLYASVALRPAVYFMSGLALEPEFIWTALERAEPCFELNGNLVYTVVYPRGKVFPFILAGYGAANSIPRFDRLFGKQTDDLDITVLNAGAGLKILAFPKTAIRLEYRFQRFTYEQSEGEQSVTVKYRWLFHNVYLGFSVFIP